MKLFAATAKAVNPVIPHTNIKRPSLVAFDLLATCHTVQIFKIIMPIMAKKTPTSALDQITILISLSLTCILNPFYICNNVL